MALSTMWFQRWRNAADLGPFFEAGLRMGFDRFELSHILTPEAVRTAQGRSIVTVHHPCPSNRDSVDASLTALDPAARDEAARHLANTVRTASTLGAEYVVFHLGRAPELDGQLSRLTFEVRSRYQANDHRWVERGDRLGQLIREAEAASLEAAAAALRPAARLAGDLGVALCWETGESPLDLPTVEGAADLLRENDLRPWLDTGHVAVRGSLGFGGLEDWRLVVGSRWAGAHLHDAVGLRDHLIPGVGDVDFSHVRAVLPRTAACTIEVDWYYEPDEVVAGARHFLATGL